MIIPILLTFIVLTSCFPIIFDHLRSYAIMSDHLRSYDTDILHEDSSHTAAKARTWTQWEPQTLKHKSEAVGYCIWVGMMGGTFFLKQLVLPVAVGARRFVTNTTANPKPRPRVAPLK